MTHPAFKHLPRDGIIGTAPLLPFLLFPNIPGVANWFRHRFKKPMSWGGWPPGLRPERKTP
jgi:hypothetical protein